MVLGFNHNIRYKGELFHVQTEDSGRANPHIITLLYRGGTIIGSAKTSYADIIKVDQLEQVVESIMKEQHKEMMRRLKGGEFDSRIFPNGVPEIPVPPQSQAEPASPGIPEQAAAEVEVAAQTPPPVEDKIAVKSQAPSQTTATPAKRSLDEVILDYLITGEE